jgi:arylsulfatase A-like enzyme
MNHKSTGSVALLVILVLPLLSIALRAAEKPSVSKPNILLIVSDDAGYADFGFQGCKDIPTPHLDRLAKGGLRFTQGYVPGCVCSPSRAGILSGKTPARIGHEFNLHGPGGIDTATVLLPARLRTAGYHTGAIGKWHLGNTEEYQPWRRGFDEFYGFLGGMNAYLVPKSKPNGKVMMLRNGVKVQEKEYLTTAFAREAVDFVERNRGRSWFLYLAFNAVHMPMQADPQNLGKFAHIADGQRQVLAAMTSSLDDAVGRVLDKLEATGLAQNTLVVFVNDNGGATYSKFYNVPLRGHKGTLFEGGVRVPFVVRWPGVLPTGRDYSQPLCATDLLPTFLAAAGAKPAAWADSDGVNLLPYLSGRNNNRPHQTLFWRMGVTAAVRDGDWKLIRIRGHEPLLFNLAADLAEAHDLAAAEPARVKTLLQEITAWEQPFPAPHWTGGGSSEKAAIKLYSGPPRYQGPVSSTITNEE